MYTSLADEFADSVISKTKGMVKLGHIFTQFIGITKRKGFLIRS